ncbi:hypothetical protein [Prevotella sp.]
MMKLKKGSYKRNGSEVGNGCNVYAKEMEVRLERDVMYMQKKWMGGWKESFRMRKGIAERLY